MRVIQEYSLYDRLDCLRQIDGGSTQKQVSERTEIPTGTIASWIATRRDLEEQRKLARRALLEGLEIKEVVILSGLNDSTIRKYKKAIVVNRQRPVDLALDKFLSMPRPTIRTTTWKSKKRSFG